MDNTKPRTVWFRRKRKDLGQAFEVLSDHPQVLRPNGSGSVLRNLFTGQKRQETKPPRPSTAKGTSLNPNSDAAQGSAQPPTQPRQHLQTSQGSPKDVPALQTPRKLVKRPDMSQVVISGTTPSKPEPQQKWSRRHVRPWKREPVDILKDLKSDIQATAQKIESKTWCSSLGQPMSSLNLRDMLTADMSPETRELLAGGLEESQEYKKEQEETRKREEEEKTSSSSLSSSSRLKAAPRALDPRD